MSLNGLKAGKSHMAQTDNMKILGAIAPESVIKIVGLLLILLGIINVVGWMCDASVRTGFFWINVVGLKFNTGLCLLLLGLTIFFSKRQSPKYVKLITIVFPAIVAVIAFSTLLEYIFNFNTGLDQLFVREKVIVSRFYPIPGRMAFSSSVNLSLTSIGLLLLRINRNFIQSSEWLFSIGAIISSMSLIGFLFGVSLTASLFNLVSADAHTSAIYLIMALTSSFINPSIGASKFFVGNQIGDRMTRRLFTLIVILVVSLVAISRQASRLQWFSFDTWIALVTVSFLGIILFIIWNTGEWLNNIEDQRAKAEQEVKALNADLEKRFEERSRQIIKSETKYRSLIEHASDAIYVVADSDGHFADVNNKTCQMLGYDREELLQMRVDQIVAPEELKIDPLVHKLGGAQTATRERTLIRKDGSTFTVEINATLFPDETVLVIARDITERKKMLKELQDAELKFRILSERSMVGVYITQNKRFLYANQRFAEIFGYERHELMNINGVIETIYAKESRALVREKIRARDNGESEGAHYEAVGLKKDGTKNQVEFYGTRVIINGKPAAIGTAMDITERKVAEEELHQSEERYRALFYGSPQPIFVYEYNSLQILDMNEVALETYGYTREEMLNITMDVLRPQDEIPKFRQALSLVQSDRKVMRFGVFNHLRKDGSLIKMDVSGYRFNFKRKDCMLVVCNDVTEKERTMEQLEQLNESLQKQARELEISNSELEQFAYVASHDLQEPLRMITSFLDRLEVKYTDLLDEKGKQYIHFATDGAKRMRQLILDLLQFSRIGRTDAVLEEIAVADLVKDVLKLYTKRIEELNGKIIIGRLPILQTYQTPLMQVFQNLISNSLKYCKEGVPPVIEISCKEHRFEYQFSVKDNGIGIDSEFFERIFVVFQRLHNKDEYSGTGMGLAITKKIIENFGGRIWVESEEGKGATFFFTIPK